MKSLKVILYFLLLAFSLRSTAATLEKPDDIAELQAALRNQPEAQRSFYIEFAAAMDGRQVDAFMRKYGLQPINIGGQYFAFDEQRYFSITDFTLYDAPFPEYLNYIFARHNQRLATRRYPGSRVKRGMIYDPSVVASAEEIDSNAAVVTWIKAQMYGSYSSINRLVGAPNGHRILFPHENHADRIIEAHTKYKHLKRKIPPLDGGQIERRMHTEPQGD